MGRKKKPAEVKPVITVGDMSEAIDRRKFDDGKQKPGVILRFGDGNLTFTEMDYDLVRASFDELAKVISLAAVGLHEFNQRDKMLWMLFIANARNR